MRHRDMLGGISRHGGRHRPDDGHLYGLFAAAAVRVRVGLRATARRGVGVQRERSCGDGLQQWMRRTEICLGDFLEVYSKTKQKERRTVV